MSRVKGDSQISISFEPTGRGPLDARLIVPTQADLVDSKTYEGKNYYVGMTVTVQEDCSIWTLHKPELLPDLDAWVKQSTGEGVPQEIIIADNCTTDNPDEALSARQGKVLDERISGVKQELDKNASEWSWWRESENPEDGE